MKDHEIAEFVNELRDTAVKHKDCQSLREAISKVVRKNLKKEKPAEKTINPFLE